MRRCAFLTTDDLEGFVHDDELLREPLALLGWQLDYVPWRSTTVDWNTFDSVVIRTPWDYQQDPQAFLAVLEAIHASQAALLNGIELVRWNLQKRYLRDLSERGVSVVPTIFLASPAPDRVCDLFRELNASEIVLKPAIGANADDTFRLGRGPDRAAAGRIAAAFAGREALAQPFIDAVVNEGEFSLFYFEGELSHAVLKTPRSGDFRVQEEHGGIITSIEPDATLRACGTRAMQALPTVPLYARPDFVRLSDGSFALMELELIEPALYFRMDPRSPARFARALERRMSTVPGPEMSARSRQTHE